MKLNENNRSVTNSPVKTNPWLIDFDYIDLVKLYPARENAKRIKITLLEKYWKTGFINLSNHIGK